MLPNQQLEKDDQVIILANGNARVSAQATIASSRVLIVDAAQVEADVKLVANILDISEKKILNTSKDDFSILAGKSVKELLFYFSDLDYTRDALIAKRFKSVDAPSPKTSTRIKKPRRRCLYIR
ncbi:hypothetical protein ACH5RR_001046 [Cinchona calisaya]|uniref:Uncharacterized protein n=1 Tax=Cinchona calisaya TaxID=153742 RepID=A0ABD3B2V1_9GENT